MSEPVQTREVWGWWRVFARDDRGVTIEVQRFTLREGWALRRRGKPAQARSWNSPGIGPAWRDMWPQFIMSLAIPFPWLAHTLLTMWLTEYTKMGPVTPAWLPPFSLWWYIAWCVACVVVQVRWGSKCHLRWMARNSVLRLPFGACLACGFDLRGAPRESDGCTVCPECSGAWRISGAESSGEN